MRFFLIVLILCSFKAIAKTQKDSLFVISFGGAGLYEQPNISSKQLTHIPYCYGLEVKKYVNELDFCASIHDTLKLEGKWARVAYNGQKGYVFDANCVPFKVNTVQFIDGFYEGKHPLFTLLGDLLPTNDADSKQVNEMETSIRYTRGKYLKKWDEDGCFQEVYTFYKANFNMVYHFLRTFNYNTEYADEKPYYVFSNLKKKEGNGYYFEEINARTEIKITLQSNGDVVLTWWVCL